MCGCSGAKIYAALNLKLSIYKGIRANFIFVTGTIYVRSTFACALIYMGSLLLAHNYYSTAYHDTNWSPFAGHVYIVQKSY